MNVTGMLVGKLELHVYRRPIWAEILSCKSVKPCKNRKNSRAYKRCTGDKSSSNSPPFQRNVQIAPSPSTMHSQMPGVCRGRGEDVEVLN